MFKNLSPGVKISISRSISTAFEQYMNSIKWDEKEADIEMFVKEWREYIIHNASWYEKVDEDIKADPAFHEYLADKINQTIDKILAEIPTEEQMAEIEELQKQVSTKEYMYSCRTEARFVIDQLKQEIKKVTPADETDLIEAAAMYYLAYEAELPMRNYSLEDIKYIIEQCQERLRQPEIDFLTSEIIH